jgi:hypothetical protein
MPIAPRACRLAVAACIAVLAACDSPSAAADCLDNAAGCDPSPACASTIAFASAAVSVEAGFSGSATVAGLRDCRGNVTAPAGAVSWSSSDTTRVGAVTGGVTASFAARAPGSATLTATVDGMTATIPVTVTPLRFLAGTVTTGPRRPLLAESCGVTERSGALVCWNAAVPYVADSTRRYISHSVSTSTSCSLVGGGAAQCSFTLNGTTHAAGPFRQMDTGAAHACVIDTAGAASCWGEGVYGQLGDGVTRATPVVEREPRLVSGGRAYAVVSAGGAHACAITTIGALWCWGLNRDGQLGRSSAGTPDVCLDPSFPCSRVPIAVGTAERFKAVSAGQAHTCAVTVAGVAYCWGQNSSGQLGTGAAGLPGPVPVPVAGGHTFTSVEAGANHSCGIRADGALLCWGSNLNGGLGIGTTDGSFTTPQPVRGGLTFASVSVGDRTTCGMTTGGIAYCWGMNHVGQVGDGTRTDRSEPTRVAWQ